jgi:thymidylate synthase|tara:strand:- start:199 stop:855 length:657 start_codon:yes stop_codon:yes gene_type:complete
MINTINNKKFQTANEAYEYLHDAIIQHGVKFGDTKALFNVGFYITEPLANAITNKERDWKLEYAEAEWQWYLTGDPKISTLGEIYGKVPQIWERMADVTGKVNSNYGWQWERNNQLNEAIYLLKRDKNTRQAAISIFDGKEYGNYTHDTPCTYAVQFTILHGKLDMCVTMRSNDLWYGFCNDQYCFSKLQQLVAGKLKMPVGIYYHFAHNMHLYNDKI